MSQAYTLYRDGEEVQVGRLEKKLDDLRIFWSVCRQTDWVHYFHGNGPGEVISKEFSGFIRPQSQRVCVGTWTIRIVGGLRRPLGEGYFKNVLISPQDMPVCAEEAWSEHVKTQVRYAGAMLDTYAKSDCTCRVGFHRRCPHHYTTQG